MRSTPGKIDPVFGSGGSMKSREALTLFGIAIILCVFALGCGGSYTPPPKLLISTTTVPAGLVNNTYNASFAATGGITPYTWTLSGGSLPVGLNLGSGGALSGIPTTAGQVTSTVQVADSEIPQATATQQVMLTINPAPPPLYVSQLWLPEGVVNTAYSAPIQIAGGLPPYSVSLTQGSLPPGLTLS